MQRILRAGRQALLERREVDGEHFAWASNALRMLWQASRLLVLQLQSAQQTESLKLEIDAMRCDDSHISTNRIEQSDH